MSTCLVVGISGYRGSEPRARRLLGMMSKPQDLRLVGGVAGMAGDPDAGRGTRPRHGRGLRDGVRVQVARRDRAPLRRQLAGKLAAHAGATAGHRREFPNECRARHLALFRSDDSAGVGQTVTRRADYAEHPRTVLLSTHLIEPRSGRRSSPPASPGAVESQAPTVVRYPGRRAQGR